MPPNMQPMAQPQQAAPGIDVNALLQMVMQMLTKSPPAPNTEIVGGNVPMGPPGFAKTPNPQQAQLMQLLQTLSLQRAGSPQNAMNANMGMMGASAGRMGGRPRGS